MWPFPRRQWSHPQSIVALGNRIYSQEQRQQCKHKSFQHGLVIAFQWIYEERKWEGQTDLSHSGYWPLPQRFIALWDIEFIRCLSLLLWFWKEWGVTLFTKRVKLRENVDKMTLFFPFSFDMCLRCKCTLTDSAADKQNTLHAALQTHPPPPHISTPNKARYNP